MNSKVKIFHTILYISCVILVSGAITNIFLSNKSDRKQLKAINNSIATLKTRCEKSEKGKIDRTELNSMVKESMSLSKKLSKIQDSRKKRSYLKSSIGAITAISSLAMLISFLCINKYKKSFEPKKSGDAVPSHLI